MLDKNSSEIMFIKYEIQDLRQDSFIIQIKRYAKACLLGGSWTNWIV